jgi:hypothetical protein
MPRRANEFQTIRSEGGLLPADLLRRLLDPKEKLEGTRPEDYGLPQDERLNETITQSWNRLRKHWAEFRAAAVSLPESEAGTGLTNDKWTLPLLRELGFGLLPTSAGPEIDGRTYAINRFFGPVPMHLVGCGVNPDRRVSGVRGASAASPHGLVQEFLNRSPSHLWAIVSNGLTLRILRDNQSLSRQSFLEFDLEDMLVGEVYSDFVLLWLLAHATRFAPREADRPETCWLERWTELSNEQGTRALGDLRGGVERALQILGEAFTGHPRNTALREALRTGQVSRADFHGQLLRVVYRLIFLFVAEDRTLNGQSLLHPRDDTETGQLARERYADHYSAARLREMASQIKGSRHGDLWLQFQLIVGALSGDAHFTAAREKLALPILGSFLWNPASTTTLNEAALTNHDFLEAIRHLAFTRQGRVLRPVDYKNLGSEELGGVYESLLALTPQISADGARFTFAEFAGNERKTSGSYYTPDSLVQRLLDSALDPVVEDAIRDKTGPEAERAILSLKVCDPAVGSGHFLVGAAHRLARHLARVRALAQGESEPSPLLYQHALRDVISHCLYGVDLSPMAAELCRVSLWLEALEPGKPLSFLDHHIRVGNSLLGATPDLIAAGLPDKAFTAIEGDGKNSCTVLKKRNKAERHGLGPLFAQHEAEIQARLQQAAAAMEMLPDDRPEDIRAKEAAHCRYEGTQEYRHKKHLADAWCAAFVIRKQFREPGSDSNASGLTQGHLTNFASGRPFPAELETQVNSLSEQFNFFHWHLAFPDAFAKGGFDCVIGNPPWERVKLQEKEFFAGPRPDLANAPTAAIRERLIERLASEAPVLFKAFHDALRQANAENMFTRHSGRYPLCAHGDFNTYALFGELATQIIAIHGRAGCVVPPGLLTDDTYRQFTESLLTRNNLISFFSFTNRGYIFPEIESTLSFSLVTIGKNVGKTIRCGAQLWHVSELDDPQRTYSLTPQDIACINPKTRTFPIFQRDKDAQLVASLHRAIPILQKGECGPAGDEWNVTFSAAFHMSGDSAYFRTLPDLDADTSFRRDANLFRCRETVYGPLYEAKYTGQFNHRSATFHNIPESEKYKRRARTTPTNQTDLRDPTWCILPRYWIDNQKVRDRCEKAAGKPWLVGFRNAVSAVADSRSVEFAVIPFCGAGHSLPLMYSGESALHTLFLVGLFNSFPLDYVARQKVSGGNLTFYLLEQLPVIQRYIGAEYVEFAFRRILELTYTAWDLEAFACDCGYAGPPFRWDEERRFLLRCELDATYFLLYLGLSIDWDSSTRLRQMFPTPNDAVSYIMDSFPIVRRKDEERYDGDYRTKRVILEMYDAMQTAMRTGQPYQTLLSPAPGPPSEPLPAWPAGAARPDSWPPHVHQPREIHESN